MRSTGRFEALTPGAVTLLPSVFRQRYELDRAYLVSLKSASLLQNHYLEAGLWGPPELPAEVHGGWESPTCQLRGHFLGHWLSAAARMAASGDAELGGKAAHVVSELARCQEENGGEWVASIPERYLEWIARGKRAWAPHYTIHKTLMGLVDMARYAGSEQALAVLEKAAPWFHRWTGKLTRSALDDVLDVETGGMLEVRADLYGMTGKQEHLDLVARYDRPRLFERLLAGDDPLTNRHANTTIPEAHGAARAYEVTGDARWRAVVEAYWRCAVTKRGTFCTGSQSNGEIWTPRNAFAARLGDKTQEHCVVYNMSRLADFLLRWTGEQAYADYIERNLYNGTLAQQNPKTGMVAYFLPLCGGARKTWGTPTGHFWCCHGSLVQAHTTHAAYAAYAAGDGVALTQYIPTEIRILQGEVPVTIRQELDTEASTSQACATDGPEHRPRRWSVDVWVRSERETIFTLRLRIPTWVAGEARLTVNGRAELAAPPGGFAELRRSWKDERVRLELPMALTTSPVPDDPETVAFLEGPVVLAGLCEGGTVLRGDPRRPEELLAPDNEREWERWKTRYRTRGQEREISFIPLHEIADEQYTTYFPVRGRR